MKKLFLSLFALIAVCGAITAQSGVKKLKVHKGGEVTHTILLSDIDSLTVAEDEVNLENYPVDETGHKYVDMGFPSGTQWATCNVGANHVAEYGGYYSWGEVETKESYERNFYKWYDVKEFQLTKYTETDKLTEVQPADDVAAVKWGGLWRMPTKAEVTELINEDNCTWNYTKVKNPAGEEIVGYVLTSKFNGNSIFLPLAGRYNDVTLQGQGETGQYWTSTLGGDAYWAVPMVLYPDYFFFTTTYSRYNGMPIRPVRKPTR